MNTLEKILVKLKEMPESDHAEVLDFVEYLKSKKSDGIGNDHWEEFSLNSAMRGIAEEPSPYGVEDIKECF
ncbi:MAG: DUF2281 domain-containing protein [Desulfobacteraceae bacterium]|jgi:hypothetical protein|nr:DUF2281 domain-containing protein [Desulfobacteraceae bacterium]